MCIELNEATSVLDKPWFLSHHMNSLNALFQVGDLSGSGNVFIKYLIAK